jgi:hypothetical protein
MPNVDLHDRIANDFTNHPPQDNIVADLLDAATEHFLWLAHWIVAAVPEGREQSLALTQLEQCSMWVKAGIARNQDQVRP